ncbi:PREDICTED: POPTR_0016s10030g [Prunus dulcis]|uniref:PREDICTED: POPTR_0016s10030g n=1 Tax=Prunus dulcis TaxID=3755 RepID=A0A5E4G2R3_PRUDU|nr:hypothetical protein L3X38_004236 [Prunus dulcis]VVA33960.1 PREDICTED: POPTR_0016s10030g [Prunus dulcis]
MVGGSDTVKDRVTRLEEFVGTPLVEDSVCLAAQSLASEEERSPLSKVKVPDLKQCSGNRNAKDLENFLWDMEQYFKAACISEEEKMAVFFDAIPIELKKEKLSALVADHPNGGDDEVDEINGIETSGATNNYLAKREVKKFGLDLAQSSCQIKTVNSEAMSVPRAAMMSLKVGLWEGRYERSPCFISSVDLGKGKSGRKEEAEFAFYYVTEVGFEEE